MVPNPLAAAGQGQTGSHGPLSHAPTTQGFEHAGYYGAGPTTGPASRPSAHDTFEHAELPAPSRGEAPAVEPGRTPIVPAGSVTGKSLTLVITIMCFLACLTAGAVYMINESASAWLRDIASEVTVQIEPREKLDVERTIKDVSAFLTRQPGVVTVRPMSAADSAALLEPWLGQSEALKSLPMPRLIALEVDRNAPPNLDVIRDAAGEAVPDGQPRRPPPVAAARSSAVTRSFALGGIAILLLVAAATTAIIVSATRSALASNREIVEVLHYVGATDRFIAREFERHFLRLGIRAGIVGAGCAMLVFLSMPFVMQALGGGSVTQAEMSRLFGSGVARSARAMCCSASSSS